MKAHICAEPKSLENLQHEIPTSNKSQHGTRITNLTPFFFTFKLMNNSTAKIKNINSSLSFSDSNIHLESLQNPFMASILVDDTTHFFN